MGKKKRSEGRKQRVRRLQKQRIKATIETLMLDLAHEDANEQPGTPRRALELRKRGSRLEWSPEAHALYEEAYALFDEADRSIPAASAAYQLAESLLMTHRSDTKLKLLRARELNQRALESKERRKSPLRYARTLDQRARIERALYHAGLSDEPFEQIRSLYRAVRRNLEGHGLAAEIDIAASFINQSNLEFDEAEDYHKAYSYRREAVQILDRVWDELSQFPEDLQAYTEHLKNEERPRRIGALIHLAQSLVQFQKSDQAITIFQRAIDLSNLNEQVFIQAIFGISSIYISLKLNKNAFNYLKLIDIMSLDLDMLSAYARFLLELGEIADNLLLHVLKIGDKRADDLRVKTSSQHMANIYAIHQGRFASIRSLYHIKKGENLPVFYSLERVMGRAFTDYLRVETFDLRDPVISELHNLRLECSYVCNQLEEISILAPTLSSNKKERAEKLIKSLGHLNLKSIDIKLIINELIESNNPQKILQKYSNQHQSLAEKCLNQIKKRQAELKAGFGIYDDPALVAQRFPEHVFVVVHLEPPGVIAALWSEDEAIKSSAARLDVTLDEIGALVEEGTFTDLLPRLGGALEGVSPADLHARHLVIVPSMAAHRIPWAAAPVSGGRRLVEVTRSIAIAPCLALYATARAPARPRQGALLVTPSEERSVYNARLAFEGREGARLEGRDARLASVLDAARGVDVLAFFTHGERSRGGASLILADAPFTLTHMGDRARLAGMERVEIWACSSGLNHPNRLFLPPAHDAYGIDVEFLRAGVRTSIGTLWDVTDATTGLIAGRYAEALGRGASAVEALAEAQRWYLREFLPEAKAQSDEVSLVRLLESHDLKLGHTLGEEALEGFVTMLEEPKAWAGFRFIGVPEDRPHGEWAPTPPLTDADRAWLEAAFAEPEAELLCWDGEAWLSEARRAALEASTVERAVEVADAYRLRLEGRRVDNLALALGWSALARARASTPAQLHRVDHLEAWILFELLVGGRPIYDLVLWPPVLGWRDAAREAAARLGGAEGACLLALIDAHVARPWRRGDPTPFVQRALSAASALDDPRRRAEALVAIADVAWSCEEIPEDLIERLTAVSLPKGEAFWAARLQSRVNLRARLLTQRAGRDVGLVWWARLLPNADLAASVAWARRLGSEHDEAADTAHDSLSEDLQVLQERAWGPVMGDELGAACRRDAAPDEAWRSGVGQLHYGHIEETGGAYARRLLVDLCLGCDPGLARAARLKWLGALGTRGGYADVSDHLALPALRRTASRLFTEATIALYTTSGPLGATPVETLPDVEGWALRTLIERHPECDPRTPTILAFERAVGGMDAIIEGVLGAGPLVETLQESPELRGYAEALLPTPHLEDIERWIGELGADTLMLGVGLGVGGQIVLVLHGEIRGARVSRATRSGLAVAPALMLHLTELLRLPELGGGVEEAHRGAWRGVEAALAPALEELLRDLEIPRGARLLLCAPGPFRRSPLAALDIQGVALLERFDEVIDLPSHTLSMTPSGGPPSVAQLGGEAHPVWRELAELDRAERLSDINAAPHDLPEIRALVSSPRRSTLRIFGEAWEGATGETAGVILAPERVALPSNLDELTLLGNEVVELWFPTVGVLDSLAPLHGGADQAPAWVEHAFTSGAGQVIDLAWRVPEPVLWTVIAHYSHARRRGEPPARALNIGLRACREVTRAAERGAVEAARSLRGSWRAAGLSRALALIDAWGEEALVTALHRRHLGAFRVWGPAR